MTPSSGSQSRLELACEPCAPRHARAHVRDVLPRWGLPEDLVDDALLIVSELATNAVRHAGGDVGAGVGGAGAVGGAGVAGPFTDEHGQPKVRMCSLSLVSLSEHLYLGVYDEELTAYPVRRPASVESESGRGLTLIDALTKGDWGCVPSIGRPGKLTWARLRIPTRNVAAPAVAAEHRSH